MTQTEQAMTTLRDAIRSELLAELRTWWDNSKDEYESAEDAIADALITLETV